MTKFKNFSDDELISLSKKGDERAFTVLFNRYKSVVQSFASKLCRDAIKADESFQDTFLNVYNKIHQFNGRSKFSTWLYAIVANNCRMKNRKTKLQLNIATIDINDEDENNFIASKENPFEIVANSELKSKLENAISKLPAEYKMVFLLRDVEMVSGNETAKILKISSASMKSRLHRAREMMQKELLPFYKK